jgi:hypothetical protein
MSVEGGITYENFTLPDSVVTKRDLYRLLRELESIDNKMLESDVRIKAGLGDGSGIDVTEQMSQFLQQNSLNLDDSNERSEIIKQTRLLKDRVSVFKVTLAGPLKHEQLIELARWMRSSIHPQLVLAVGLQPSLVAGAHIRTPNKIFDFSFKAALEKNRNVLIDEISGLTAKEYPSV